MFGIVSRLRRASLQETRLGMASRDRAKARLRETYERERSANESRMGESRFEEFSFRGEAAPAAKPSWESYFLDDRFARPKPVELEPLAAEFTYEAAPGVEITVASPEDGWDLWDKACMELHQDIEAAEGGSASGKID